MQKKRATPRITTHRRGVESLTNALSASRGSPLVTWTRGQGREMKRLNMKIFLLFRIKNIILYSSLSLCYTLLVSLYILPGK